MIHYSFQSAVYQSMCHRVYVSPYVSYGVSPYVSYRVSPYMCDSKGAMETPQHGIGPKKPETSPKWIFWGVSCFFQKLSEIPQIQFLEEFPVFFYPFPRFLDRIPVYQGIMLRDFPIFLKDFPIFSIRFLIFWVRFRFSEKV